MDRGLDRCREGCQVGQFRRRMKADVFEDGMAGLGRSLAPRCPGAQAVQAGNDHQPPRPGDAEQFGDGARGFLEELDGGHRYRFIKGTVGKREPSHVPPHGLEAMARGLLSRPPQHGERKLEPDHTGSGGEEIQCEDAGAATDIEDPFPLAWPGHF